MKSFHFSVDDVLPALIEVTDKNIPLVDNQFFNQLRIIYEKYGVKTGLNLFYSHNIDGKVRYLSEVRDIKEELKDGWLYFAPHSLDFDTPPYSQNINDQIKTLEMIMNEIKRIAGGYKASSVRFHYYSECYEIAENILNHGINEIFITDKLIGSYKLPKSYIEEIIEKGSIRFNGLKVTRTNFRVENFANERFSKDKLTKSFSDILNKHSRIVIYSHEYEHSRKDVNKMLMVTMDILVNKLGLISEIP
jgi:hypothetical protein